jgi:hypothetical protein
MFLMFILVFVLVHLELVFIFVLFQGHSKP